MYVTTDDGVRLYVQTSGSGSETVLIPNGIFLAADFERLTAHRTLIFYDVRNRGLSDPVNDSAKLARGIHNDVDDLDAVRRHFQLDRIDVIGHSYVGLTVALYAMRHADRVNRVVQIGPPPLNSSTPYPPELSNNDAVLAEAFAKIGELYKGPQLADPEENCARFWSVLNAVFVFNPADAAKVTAWGRCDLPNERAFMGYWTERIFPSITKLKLTAEDFAKVTAQVLTVHGTKDRSAPYGGGKDWAKSFPNGRLLTIENVAHAPWIEAPEVFFNAVEAFLAG